MKKTIILAFDFIIIVIGFILLINYNTLMTYLVHNLMYTADTMSILHVLITFLPFVIALLISGGISGVLILTNLIKIKSNKIIGLSCLVVTILFFLIQLYFYVFHKQLILGYLYYVLHIDIVILLIPFTIIFTIASGYVHTFLKNK